MKQELAYNPRRKLGV